MDKKIDAILEILMRWEPKITKLDSLDSLDRIDSQIATLNMNVKQCTNRVDVIEDSQLTNNNEIKRVKCDLEFVKVEINQLRQDNLSDQFVLFGLPPDVKTNSSRDVIKQFCSSIERPIEDADIKNCFARPAKNNTEAIIIGTFCSSNIKSEVMKAFAGKKATFAENVLNLEPTSKFRGKQIVIRNRLTLANRQLLAEAKRLNDGFYKFIWESNGRIMLKKAKGARPITVISMAHLIEIMNESRRMQTEQQNHI